ncbi:MAG: acetylxylan esterase [Marinilabiliaceae bacterium]|nr:acetylxylan esterase [Marinilabiliaceae bacterium]
MKTKITRKYLLTLLAVMAIQMPSIAQNYPHQSDVLWVTTPDSPDWLYSLKQEARITVAVYEHGMVVNDADIAYQCGSELMPTDQQGTVRLKNGAAMIPMGTLTEPGFRDCSMQITLNGHTYKHHIKVGFAPHKLKPYTQQPEDFMTYWENAKDEASRCPMEVTRTYVPEYSSDKTDCYLVKLQAYKKGQYVYGYLTQPKAPGKYPVVISPPGAGIKPMNPLKEIFYADNGLIRFDMEIHGIRPDLDEATYKEISAAFGTANNSYLVNGIDNRDTYYLKKVYLSLLRAIDYLTTLPEWDGKNLMAQGNSQGGALALVATALDQRITACAVAHPALSDMAGYKANRAGGYPHLFTNYSNIDTPEKLNTLAYYDVVNFARHIRVPTYMTWGYNDNVCPPTTSYIVYNTLTCPKTAYLTPVNEHWVSQNTRRHIMSWLVKQVK